MPELDGDWLFCFTEKKCCSDLPFQGVGATKEIRDIEARTPDTPGTTILALTGMSTLEDKRRAFEAGVDG